MFIKMSTEIPQPMSNILILRIAGEQPDMSLSDKNLRLIIPVFANCLVYRAVATIVALAGYPDEGIIVTSADHVINYAIGI